jgi:hypothetical protein
LLMLHLLTTVTFIYDCTTSDDNSKRKTKKESGKELSNKILFYFLPINFLPTQPSLLAHLLTCMDE